MNPVERTVYHPDPHTQGGQLPGHGESGWPRPDHQNLDGPHRTSTRRDPSIATGAVSGPAEVPKAITYSMPIIQIPWLDARLTSLDPTVTPYRQQHHGRDPARGQRRTRLTD
ncbi:hypothetical protein [Micromonospora sp. NPDC005206]|uniref:hypothetical protein n=1 Tax=Micromonospora sp. NPDC005206 TaxID=3157022 RepID=UPI0033BC4A6A